ncbi:hypothetical protein PHYPSEUDO_005928 [Phytophthora pseudosyringae]|uniref:Glucose-methanol-choline oxidoreductase C-terminal domain-containing protein n=1 Tax=Phytophthora pseudosyringae TaxID=221518 RepID=A0A8T1VJU9_9STRA|nr:hypothetical protein PHYPSEUDO_005928 [Phytophthora pseudosyringae]
MGLETDVNTVVDAQTRVHGLEGLRIVDASVMPNNVSGNLNTPTIMLAETAADVTLGKPDVPPRVRIQELGDKSTMKFISLGDVQAGVGMSLNIFSPSDKSLRQ